jgi:hypothetical protein
MEDPETASKVLGNAIIEWLADEALRESEPATLFGELCQRLRAIGTPILRGWVAFRVLHPLYNSSSLTWNAEKGVIAARNSSCAVPLVMQLPVACRSCGVG